MSMPSTPGRSTPGPSLPNPLSPDPLTGSLSIGIGQRISRADPGVSLQRVPRSIDLADIAVIGLAVMGQNLILKIDDYCYTVVAFNLLRWQSL